MALQEHAWRVLELPKVLERLSQLADSSAGRELVLGLRPASQTREVRTRLQATAEAQRLLSLRPGFALSGARDVRSPVELAAKGGLLEPSTLLDIMALLETARSTVTIVQRHAEELAALRRLIAGVRPQPELERSLRGAISPRGEVLETASPLLSSLRRQVREEHDRLMGRLRQLLQRSHDEGWVQEPIITQRNDRYVLPVKAEFRSHLRGIVHDVSATGATLFVEPLETVELGNAWKEAQLEERREVERILRRLSTEVGACASELVAIVEGLAQLDLALAKARLASEQQASLPTVVARGAVDGARPSLRLIEARHPLLTVPPVPISFTVGGVDGAPGDEVLVLLVSGPNTGGKTVALKTAGLLTLMAQCGLAIPAGEGSRVPVFDGVYADIGDEQSIEQSLSTFSSHLRNIVAALRVATDRSLLLLDELAAGTDPTEGSALARALLLHVLDRRITVVATTHHGELKALAHVTPGMQNASVEFDPETLAPTYHLIQGLPGASNALSIAAQLGMPRSILQRARSLVSPEQRQVEAILADLQEQRRRAHELGQQLEAQRAETDRLQSALQSSMAQLEEERGRLIEAARQRALSLVQEVEADLARLARRWARPQFSETERQQALKALAGVRERIARVWGPPPSAPEFPIGEWVNIPTLGLQGQIASPPDAEGRLTVQAGALRVAVAAGELEAAQSPAGARRARPAVEARPAPPAALELDLRGRRADEAEAMLDAFLNDAFLSDLHSVRVIHGYGTGALRDAVRDLLRRHPLVTTFHAAEARHGGAGVTVAELKTED